MMSANKKDQTKTSLFTVFRVWYLKYPTDPNNNKSPISFNKYGVADMNHAVGKQIGLPGFEGKCVGELNRNLAGTVQTTKTPVSNFRRECLCILTNI